MSNIFKLKLSPEDILFIRTSNPHKFFPDLQGIHKSTGAKNPVVFLNPHETVKTVSEEKMKMYGWIRDTNV